MADPYLKKDPGDIIRAQDWNDMQSRARATRSKAIRIPAARRGRC